MRSFASFILFFFLCFKCFTQQDKKVPIVSGHGVGEIRLGMNEEDAIAILKGSYIKRSYLEQMKEFKHSGTSFNIENIAEFVVGFDTCIVYDGAHADNYPIFNLYFLNHKLKYVTLTAAGADSTLLSRFVLDDELQFGHPMERCMESLGCDYINLHYEEYDYDGDHLYYNRGLEVIYDDQKLLVICLFVPDKNFPLKMTAKKDQLKNEFAAIDPD